MSNEKLNLENTSVENENVVEIVEEVVEEVEAEGEMEEVD